MNNLRRHALAAATACLFVSQVFAAEYSLPLTDDAYVHGLYPTSKFGASTSLNIHTYGPMQSLIRFDPAVVAGQSISKATLILRLQRLDAPGAITVHPLLSSWSEGTVTWALQPPSESIAAANIDMTNARAGADVTVDVTNVVQRWANGTLAHAGLLLKSPTAKKAYFDSKELVGGTRARLDVVTADIQPPGVSSTPEVILNFSTIPVVIDKPGVYVLDRDWKFERQVDSPALIQVRSEDVTIDMRNHRIEGAFHSIDVENSSLRLMNGSLYDEGYPPTPFGVGARNSNVTIDRMSISGVSSFSNSVYARGVLIRDSTLGGTSSTNSTISIERCSIGDRYRALTVNGGIARIRDSNIHSGEEALILSTNRSTLTGNTIGGGLYDAASLVVEGDSNVLANNIVSNDTCNIAIRINGTSNVLKGNLVSADVDSPCGTGISFQQPGNAYGGNYAKSFGVPFQLNGMSQTDLGGNVSF